MTTPNETQLHEALQLSKEKSKLEKEIQALQNKIESVDAKIQKALGGTSSPAPKAAKAPKAPKAAKEPKAPKAPKEGEPRRKSKLKDVILEILASAGSEGMNLQDLSEKTGKEARHLSVWFSTTGSKMTEITKVGRGTYALTGAASAPATPAKEEAPAPEGDTETLPTPPATEGGDNEGSED